MRLCFYGMYFNNIFIINGLRASIAISNGDDVVSEQESLDFLIPQLPISFFYR